MKTGQQNHQVQPTALIVGARRFLYSAAARRSPRIVWWEAGDDGEPEITPPGLKMIFMRSGLARKEKLKDLAKSCGAELIEFSHEREIFPALAKLVELEPDRAKEATGPQIGEAEAEAGPPTEDLRLKLDRVIDIPVNRIRPFKGQPRTHFDADALRRLARSIQAAGQKVPIIVTPVEGSKDHDYQIYDGERRWRAAQMIHKPTLRAIVADSISDAAMFKGSAVCNFGREDHQPMEVALAIKKIREAEHLRLDAVADIFGHSVAWVSQHLVLLSLAPSVQAQVDPGLPEDQQLTVQTALEIAKLPTERQAEAAQHILKRRLSIFKTRYYVRHLVEKFGASSPQRRRGPDDDFRVLDAFIERTRTRAEELLNLPGRTLRDVFTYRTKKQGSQTVARLGELVKRLREMQAAIAGEKS